MITQSKTTTQASTSSQQQKNGSAIKKTIMVPQKNPKETEFRLPKNKLYYLLFAFGIFCFLLGFVIGRDTFSSPISGKAKPNEKTMPPIAQEGTLPPSGEINNNMPNKKNYEEARKLAKEIFIISKETELSTAIPFFTASYSI